MRTRDEAPAARRARRSPIQTKKLEQHYARQLRKVARHVAEIVNGFAPNGDLSHDAEISLSDSLRRYSETIGPWAKSVANRMLGGVESAEAKQWMAHSQAIGRGLRREVYEGATGRVMRERLAEQVSLIKSLPLDAAQRVHDLTLKGLTEGARANEIAAEIMRTGEVTKSRATLIARTEVSRTASLLTEARAQTVGSVEYIWRSSQDAQVRPSHKALNGKVFRWDSPPTVDGMKGNAGCFPNCRCYPEPIIPD